MKNPSLSKKAVMVLLMAAILSLGLPLWVGAQQERPGEGEKKKGGKIEIIPEQHDFGNISPQERNYTFTFTIRNIGPGDLVIYHIATSCPCTTAALDKKTIAPGETGKLVVNYDPNFHHSSEKPRTGPVKRTIYIYSSDLDTPQKTVAITGLMDMGRAPKSEAPRPEGRGQGRHAGK